MGIVLRLLGITLTVAAGFAIARVRTTTSQQDYAILEIDPAASAADIRRAYRDLVQVWHPDRFAHDPQLQRKAQAKLQAINDAYARLRRRAA